MKRNLSLLILAATCVGASWSAETPAQFGVSDDNFAFDLKLKPSVSKILPSGERYEKVPAWTPVVNMPKAPASHNKGYTLDSVVSVKPDGTPYSKQCFTYNEAGKILSQTDYLYVAKADTFKISNQYLYSWFDNGYLKSSTQIASDGSAMRNEYKYNDQLLGIEQLTLRRAKGTTEFVNYRKGEYDYDERGNMTLEVIYVWKDDAWVKNSEGKSTYDENNYRASIEIWKLQNGAWVGTEKKEYVNSPTGRNTLLVNYSWERKTPGIFEPFSRLTQIFKEDDDSYLVTQKFEYYNLEEKAWTGNFADRGGAQRNNMIADKKFDDKGRVILSFAETLYGTEWRRGSYSDYVYTDSIDGSYKCVKTHYLRTPEEEEYRNTEILTTKVNAAGLETFNQDKVLTDIKRSTEIISEYDAKGNKILQEDYKFDASGNRYPYLKAVNKYDDYGNIIDTYNWGGKKNDQGIPDSWIYSSHFTYNYEMNGTIRTDKRRYKYVAATESWATDFGDGADFDFTVPVSDIVIPTGYNAEYMQTAKYSYKGDGEGWDITKYTYFYSKNEQDGINDVIAVQGKISFSNNILRVNGGTTVENSVYSTEGRLVYSGTSHEENLGNLIRGIYVVRSIVDGKASVMKVVVK